MGFKDALNYIQKTDAKLLLKYHIGLERETLRTSSKGLLSLKGHPKSLGSSLTHPHISTDFSESQLELITPVFETIKDAIQYTKHLQTFVYKHLGNELLWPFSMPCSLPKKTSIPIAKYGSSDTGQEKEIYRRGLVYRYGIDMQLISGIHANFSFQPDLLKTLFKREEINKSFQQFKNESYFNVIRNFLYEGWILSYLFGASTQVDRSYKTNLDISKLKHITSLRMSTAGYYNKTGCQHNVSFSDLDSYIYDLTQATTTTCKEFSDIGLLDKGKRIQLNDFAMQIENEHYARIRPKAHSKIPLRPLLALQNYGVEYLEIRSLDIDPFSPIGISENQLYFLYVFLLYSLLKTPTIKDTRKCSKQLLCNQNSVSLKGRDPKLELESSDGKTPLKTWSLKILSKMKEISKILDKSQNDINFTEIVENEEKKILTPSLTLSAKLEKELKEHNYIDYGIKLAKVHKRTLLEAPLPKTLQSDFGKLSKKSLQDQKLLEEKEYFELKDHEDLEQSTQILIRECFNKGLKVEVINRDENLIKISKKDHVEYVKQATITSKDSYLTFHLLSNKHDTKLFLEKSELNFPKSITISHLDDALASIETLKTKLVVIKPAKANFGHGISFVEKSNISKLKKAIELGLSFGSHLLIEEFVKGDEYRFLIIDDKVIAVLKRDPANVLGDGTSTIAKLIKHKNSDPKSFKAKKDEIRLGNVEKEFLKNQGLNTQSIPKKGERIFLRANSNISTGGDSCDFTQEMPKKFSNIALNATKALDAKICGVDMIIPNLKKDSYSILELNYNPNIAMHYYPYEGTSRNAAPNLLKLLGF